MVGVVYGLFCPDTGHVRYVGATTTSLSRRLGRHLAHTRQADRNSPLVRWLRSLTSPPSIVQIVAVLDGEDLRQREESVLLYIEDVWPGQLLNSRRPGQSRAWTGPPA